MASVIITDIEAVRRRMKTEGPLDSAAAEAVSLVAGADLSFWPHRPELAIAVLTLCALEPLRLIWLRACVVPLPAEYRAGFLAQREAEPILALLNQLQKDVVADTPCLHKKLQDALAQPAGPDGWFWRSRKDALRLPDAVLIDGCGFLHHFRAGLASVVAVNSGFPAAGVAKSLLEVEGISRHTFEPAWEAATAASSKGSRAAGYDVDPDRPAGGAGSATQNTAPDAASIALAGATRVAATESAVAGSVGSAEQAVLGAKGATTATEAKRVYERGQAMNLVASDGTVLGRALRTFSRSKWPVYVSVGSGMSLDAACTIALRCAGVGSVPFPIQEADRWGRHLAAAWPPPSAGAGGDGREDASAGEAATKPSAGDAGSSEPSDP